MARGLGAVVVVVPPRAAAVVFIVVVGLALVAATGCHGAGLKVGFYNKTCPKAEALVKQAVSKAVAGDTGLAAGLLRMHFHDCFVRGCDASVLLDSANRTAEKDAIPNFPSLRGFEVVDAAKTALEAACPGIVSCADILAFAARDSIVATGGPSYNVPAGRRDGLVSIKDEALPNLPSPFANATELIRNFARKNLNAEEMVVLSGAHTLGRSHCGAFTNRLYDSAGVPKVDPTLSLPYGRLLQNICPANNASPDTTTAMDLSSPDVFDNRYYVGVQLALGLFTSDQALVADANLSSLVQEFAAKPSRWLSKFTKSMVKMGNIEVLTGTQGQIRRNCRAVNSRLDIHPQSSDRSDIAGLVASS